MTPARVRFAPSPTGHFHLGGARTALYNFLLARQTGGQFILRIEDTDRKRNTPEALDELKRALTWLGLVWDEGPDVGGPCGPYLQSERKELYLAAARRLLASGHAYRCFCPPERLQRMREDQQRRHLPPRYDGRCRELVPAEAERRAASEPHVIRFRTPREGKTVARDFLRGDITVENAALDDFILVKSDGFALYHLAAMVDDHEMRITHVFRGEEWLGTFPLHVQIVRALGYPEPVWCHLSVFLKPSGKGKMSKRDVNSEQSIFVLGLEELGYVPEAVVNWIALMGASYGGEDEVLGMADLIARFRLEALNPSPARVNFDKLDHFNGVWLRRLDPDDLAARMAPFFHRAGLAADVAFLRRLVPILRERIVTLPDAVELAGFFFRSDPVLDPAELTRGGLDRAASREAIAAARQEVAGIEPFGAAGLEAALRALARARGLKPGVLFGMLRLAVTGQAVSPPLFETMEIAGRETVLRRLDAFLAALGGA